jgi:dethiobiotin synthetase
MPAAVAAPRRGLFVAGTDTDVGKTAVAVAVARSLCGGGRRVGVYKPVASGIASPDEPDGDPRQLWEAAGRPGSLADVCPQFFSAAIAPARAAAAAGRAVDESLLRTGLAPWHESDVVVVEGAGGLFSPLARDTLNADLARDFALPLVIVDSTRLGSIGRTLATVRAARAEGLCLAACVLSHVTPLRGRATEPDSDEQIAAAAEAELRRLLPDIAVTRLGHGATEFAPPLDWWAAAGMHGGERRAG